MQGFLCPSGTFGASPYGMSIEPRPCIVKAAGRFPCLRPLRSGVKRGKNALDSIDQPRRQSLGLCGYVRREGKPWPFAGGLRQHGGFVGRDAQLAHSRECCYVTELLPS